MDTKTVSAEEQRIERLKSAWGCEWLRPKRQLAGKSGARLHLVDVKLDGYDGQAILKISTDDLSNESDKQKRGLELSPKFGSLHFPKVVRYDRFDEGSALLMTVAGHGLLFTSPFSLINNSPFRMLAGQSITDQLLNEWNADAKFSNEDYTATQFLQNLLGHRIGPTSRLPSLIEELYGTSADTEGFEILGARYPNPLSFASSDAGRSNNAKLNPIFGFLHGDLHGWNVLVSEYPPTPSEFYIIDFDSFEESKPLLFDNAYLELSYLLKQRENAVLDRWISLLESLENVEETSGVVAALKDTEDQGHVWFAAFLRSTINSWRDKRFPERKEDITKQRLLARVAAGLNIAQKAQLDSAIARSSKLKEFAFLYAASNLRAFLKFTKLEKQITYVSIDKTGDAPKSISSAWRDVWDACDGFNEDRNVFLLIASPVLGDQSQYCRNSLAQIPKVHRDRFRS
jgi:hypothetical protein